MGQRIDVNHENIYYGDFLAVEDVNINIEPNKVTSFIGPSGCGKSTVLRTLDRMHEIIPGAHVEGEVLLDGHPLAGWSRARHHHDHAGSPRYGKTNAIRPLPGHRWLYCDALGCTAAGLVWPRLNIS